MRERADGSFATGPGEPPSKPDFEGHDRLRGRSTVTAVAAGLYLVGSMGNATIALIAARAGGGNLNDLGETSAWVLGLGIASLIHMNVATRQGLAARERITITPVDPEYLQIEEED